MKNLLAEYHDIYEDSKRWNFYDSTNDNKDHSIFSNEESARRFVENYFTIAGKNTSILIACNSGRYLHSVSTFFLGVYIKENIFPDLLEIDKIDLESNSSRPKFLYFWFLISLYHDFGYVVEQDKNVYPPKELEFDALVEKLKKELLGNPSTFYGLLDEVNCGSNYKIETIKRYYDYCRKTCINTVNHGIVGGLLLYHTLQENYFKKKQYGTDNPSSGEEEGFFDERGLYYDRHHQKYYKKVSSAIIDHNIWLSGNDVKCKRRYRYYKLHELTKEPMSIEDNKILFFLALVDTIEPIKFFNQHNSACLLDKISIEVNGGEKRITLAVDDSCIAPEDWFKKIKSLETWFKVGVEAHENMISVYLT